MKKLRIFGVALCALCAWLALTVASTSSPLYATNFWTDTNIYFTIGRGMTQGLMPYRDLFDHKGPLLYLIYGLGALVSDTSFAGVFLLETVSLFLALLAAWRIVSLDHEGVLTLAAIPLTAIVTVTCTAFNQGGSAEEFCLPALILALWAVMCRLGDEACPHPLRLYGVFGAAMGWVFAIKYTDCGLFFGLACAALCWEWRVRGFARALRAGVAILGGMLLIVLPVAAYLAANGVLRDCVQVYFIQNLFDYSGTPMSLTGHVYNALAYLRTQSAANPAVAALAAFGCAYAAVRALAGRKRGCIFAALAAPLGAGLLLLFCYWGEMAHPYYALVFAALTPLGLLPLGRLSRKLTAGGFAAVPVVVSAAIVPVCLLLCAAAPLRAVKREDMPQAAFAAIMNGAEAPTLLDLTSLDQGFYLAAGITPNCRYFADNNLNTEEKREAIAGYIESGAAQFIVTRYADVGEGYELIAEDQGVFDLNDLRTYKLYRRIDRSEGGMDS